MCTSARPPSDMGLVASRHAADSPRASDGLLTGGGRAGIRLMPTFCDIPRWAAARRRTIHGRETDTPRATHGRTTGGARASLRTSDGRATGGLRSDLDKPRDTKIGGGCAATGYTRTCLRAAYGRHNDTRQDRCAGRRGEKAHHRRTHRAERRLTCTNSPLKTKARKRERDGRQTIPLLSRNTLFYANLYTSIFL